MGLETRTMCPETYPLDHNTDMKHTYIPNNSLLRGIEAKTNNKHTDRHTTSKQRKHGKKKMSHLFPCHTIMMCLKKKIYLYQPSARTDYNLTVNRDVKSDLNFKPSDMTIQPCLLKNAVIFANELLRNHCLNSLTKQT